MNIRNKIYIVLNILASICYFIAFFTKSMYFLGLGGCILILNALSSMIFDTINKRKKKLENKQLI